MREKDTKFYLYNEDCFNSEKNEFLLEECKERNLETISNKRVISYKKEYKNKESYIKEIMSEFKFENSVMKNLSKKSLESRIKCEQEIFERTITLEKDKHCISIESSNENEKFNVADFLGVHANMILFRNKDSCRAFNLSDFNIQSLEQRAILNFLEKNKYDNEKNRAVFRKIKIKLKLQKHLLFSAIILIILGIWIAISGL